MSGVNPRNHAPSPRRQVGKEKETDFHQEDIGHDFEDDHHNDSKDAISDFEPLLKNSENGTTIVAAAHSNEDTEEDTAEFWKTAQEFMMCAGGLMISYLTWGYMQELIMTSTFNATTRAPEGKFPSSAFCVFSNRLLAVIVAMIVVKIRHGAVFANNKAPLWAFCPPALSNTISSTSQYEALKYVSFPEQTVFKSSKIIAVMMMGKALQGKSYPWLQYFEAFLITIGVIIFSLASKEEAEDRDNHTEIIGLVLLCVYIAFDSFTSQYQDKVYQQYGRDNVDPYQMMLGVNISAIFMTTFGLVVSGEIPIVWEFLLANPNVAFYNLLTAITSASGQICIFYTIQKFGPIVFTIIMTTRQMLSICLSTIIFGHVLKFKAVLGALLVFCVLFDRIRRRYKASTSKKVNTTGPSTLKMSKDVEMQRAK